MKLKNNKYKNLLTNIEFVGYGHPDRFADYLAEKISNYFYSLNKKTKTAIEIMVTRDKIFLGGEVGRVLSTTEKENIEAIVYNTINEIYGEKWWPNYKNVKIINNIKGQSPELSKIVDNEDDEFITGDQGVSYGFWYYPRMNLINDVYNALNNTIKAFNLAPDYKALLSNNTLLISFCGLKYEYKEFLEKSIKVILEKWGFNVKINKLDWNIAGPLADTGMVGRKLMIESFGTGIPHGGGASCVDGETEYLTPQGWKKIKDYDGGQVGQYTEVGTLEFVKPTNYINTTAEKMYHFKSLNNLDMILSENHDIVYRTDKFNLNKKPVKEVIEIINKNKLGFSGGIPRGFNYFPENKGIDLSDDEIRLQVAINADGYFLKNSKKELNGKVGINIKRLFKVKRLFYLLDKLNIKYIYSQYGGDYHRFVFTPPRLNKHFTSDFWNCNLKQLKIINDEVTLWDGNRSNKHTTSSKSDADFIQFVFTIFNGSSVMNITGKKGEKPYWMIVKSNMQNLTLKRKTTMESDFEITEVKTIDGRMYCFTVPSGMLVLRRNNKIFITGNCGKDWSKADKSGLFIATKIAKNFADTFNVKAPILVELDYFINNTDIPYTLKVGNKVWQKGIINFSYEIKQILNWLPYSTAEVSKTGLVQTFLNTPEGKINGKI